MNPYKNYPLPARIFRKLYPLVERFGGKIYEKFAYKYFFIPLDYPFPEVEIPYKERSVKSTIQFENEKIQVYEWGNPNSEKKVILVHGWAGRATQFRSIIDQLETDYHVISFDSPGHGMSSGKSTNLLEMAALTAEITNKYGAKLLIGHSLGGAACVYAIANHSIKIEQLTLISAPSSASKMLKDFLLKLNGGTKTYKYIKTMVKQKFDKELDDFFAEKILPISNFPPTLAFHDEVDYEVHFDHLSKFEKLIEKVKIVTTTNLGHTKILRDEKVISEIKNFLS